jgi:hypothetical protein
MYYFALITSDYCEQAEISMLSLFRYNDIKLNLFVVDSGYKEVVKYYSTKPYKDHLNIINIYDEEHNKKLFDYPHNDTVFASYPAHLTLWTFRIFDYIQEDEIFRIDLDILYFGDISRLCKYDNTLVGLVEKMNNRDRIKRLFPKEHTSYFQINVGLCKFIKSKFNLNCTFEEEMTKRLDADAINYLVPEQDILNELTNDKHFYRDSIIITNYADVGDFDENADLLGFHFNGSWVKPWKTYEYSAIQITNFNFVAGVELCYEFSKQVDFFRKNIRMNYMLTHHQYENTKLPKNLRTKRIVERMINEVRSWTF